MHMVPLLLVLLLRASILGKARAKVVIAPHLTASRCVIGANCTIEWLTDDCDQEQKVRPLPSNEWLIR
jgi:hypothetical protein